MTHQQPPSSTGLLQGAMTHSQRTTEWRPSGSLGGGFSQHGQGCHAEHAAQRVDQVAWHPRSAGRGGAEWHTTTNAKGVVRAGGCRPRDTCVATPGGTEGTGGAHHHWVGAHGQPGASNMFMSGRGGEQLEGTGGALPPSKHFVPR